MINGNYGINGILSLDKFDKLVKVFFVSYYSFWGVTFFKFNIAEKVIYVNKKRRKTMKTIWILWWNYSDISGCEIVRAYEDEQRAHDDFALVENDTTRYWHISPVELFGSNTK